MNSVSGATAVLPLLVLWVALCSGVARADEVIHLSDWRQVRNATAVLQLPALQRVVGRYEAEAGSKIIIRFPGGDEGSAWATELRDWLVSLGISSSEIRLEPGSGIPQAIVLATEPGGAP